MTPEQYASLKFIIDNELSDAQSKIESIKSDIESLMVDMDEDSDELTELTNAVDYLEAACADIDSCISNLQETNPGD